MGGGGTTTQTDQTTDVSLPKWVEKAAHNNYELAREISKQKMDEVYTGPEVADQSNMTTDAYRYMMANVGAQDPLYENAADLSGRVTELDPRYAEAHNLYRKSTGAWDPTEYLNPYTEEVEKRATANAQRSLDQSLMASGDAARKAGAFGGSTSAVQQGVLASEGARSIGDLSAELRRAGYDKATADMIANRQLQQSGAQGMITGAGQQQQGWLSSAKSYLDTAAGRGAQVAADFGQMMAGGQSEEAQRQKQLDAARAKFYEKRDLPLEQLNIRLAALGMSPYGRTEHTEGTQTQTTSPDWASVALGGFKLLGGLSDRRDKKDIQKLGKDKKTGIPIYAYRYKDASASSPKVVGPMAQDIEKVWPEAVKEIGGHKIIRGDILGVLSA